VKSKCDNMGILSQRSEGEFLKITAAHHRVVLNSVCGTWPDECMLKIFVHFAPH
jgi:hypothetical protein